MSHLTLQSKVKFKPRDYQEPILESIIAHCKKKVAKPAFVDISVGGGKTAIYAFIADHVANKGGKVMVLARQGELVEQNSGFCWKAGFKNSVFCASLNQKAKKYPIVYASEGTVARQICEGGDFGYTTNENGRNIATWVPDLLMIDECHQVNYEDPENQYMKIINFFMAVNPRLRIVGGTGSPIRGKKYIVGDFWSERLYELPTNKLVEWGWLVPPIFGFPEDSEDSYDFSSIAVDKDADSFSDADLDEIVLSDPTLTHNIVCEIVSKTKNRLGVLIFCSTKKHCKEAVQALPKGSYGIVSDDTPFKERTKIYKASRDGKIKFLVNVGVLATGYNNPRIDTVCYLRPLDSLTLLIQTMGRGFRIPEDDDDFEKVNCLVLDYADVFARLGDLYENPMLEEGMKQSAKRKDQTVPCPKCDGDNSPIARRCINLNEELVRDNERTKADNALRKIRKEPLLDYVDERCDFFFSFRVCPNCETQNAQGSMAPTQNDPCARQCRLCGYQLIDPNAKLNGQHYTEKDLIKVIRFEALPCKNKGLYLKYYLENGDVAKEFFSPFGSNKTGNRIYKAQFVNQHISSNELRAFYKLRTVESICSSGLVMAPKKITHRIGSKGKSLIHRKIF
jgi:superfamily II DNA or RNA helicase